jgi:hypothetical protein
VQLSDSRHGDHGGHLGRCQPDMKPAFTRAAYQRRYSASTSIMAVCSVCTSTVTDAAVGVATGREHH